MSKINQNRLAFFALGTLFGGYILGMLRRAASVGGSR